MADDKIVTKKTAAKPAATPIKKAPAKAAGSSKTVSKKSVPKPAASPVASPATAKSAAPPVAPRPAPSPPAAAPAPTVAKAAVRKASESEVRSGEPPLADPNVHPVPLEEKPVSLLGLVDVTPEHRLAMIREAAYYKAEKRSFAAGNDAQDWADAEREIDELLAKARAIYGA